MLIKHELSLLNEVNQKLDNLSFSSSCTSSASSISIDYESKSTFDLNPQKFKCPFDIDTIPHFSQVKPKDYKNYYYFPSANSSISETESIICSSPIQQQPTDLPKDILGEDDLIQQSNKKLDALIELIQDIHKKKNQSCVAKCKAFNIQNDKSPISSLNSSNTGSIEENCIRKDHVSNIYSERSIERSKSVQSTAYSLAQRRADLLINDVKIRENLERLKRKIKTYKDQAFSETLIREQRNGPLLTTFESPEEDFFEEHLESPLKISIALDPRPEVGELTLHKMPYDYDFAEFLAFKKQKEAAEQHLNNSKKIRFIYGTEKSLDEISLSSSLKGTKSKGFPRSNSANRVTFNDTIEFYDPALQNRANYSLEEFAMIKANPNLVIKNTNSSIVNPFSSFKIGNGDREIPIEVDNIEKDSLIPDSVTKIAPRSDFLISTQPKVELKSYNKPVFSTINTPSKPNNSNNTNNNDLKFSETIKPNKSRNKFDLNNHYDTINEQQRRKYSIDLKTSPSASSKISPHYSVPKKITKLSEIEKKLSDTETKLESPRVPTPLPQDKYAFEQEFSSGSYSSSSNGMYQAYAPNPSMAKSLSAGDFKSYPENSYYNNDYEDIKFQNSLSDFKMSQVPLIRIDPPAPATNQRKIVEIKNKKTESEFKGHPYSESLTNLSSVAYTISNSPHNKPLPQFRPRGIVKIKNNTNLSRLSESNLSLNDNKPSPKPVPQFRPPPPPQFVENPAPTRQPVPPQIRPKTPPSPQIRPKTPPPRIPCLEPESEERQIPIEIVNLPEPARVVLKKIETIYNHQNSGDYNLITVTDRELSDEEIKQVAKEISEAEKAANCLSKSKVFNEANYETDYLMGSSAAERRRRSSRIGEEQNERELNSIFKRIYNRHRFSLASNEATNESKSRSKSPGIRRFMNSNNLSQQF